MAMNRIVMALAALSILIGGAAVAAPPWSSLGEAVAIQGYDSVAYFTKSDAVRGSSKFLYDWNGMSWFFASAENRDTFAAAPEKYAPQFGGFCTPSVASGKTSRGGGDAWLIHDGKLYLSYDQLVRENLRRDLSGTVSRASGWWPTVKARIEKQ
jgi:YHS domain-containing protein